MRAPEDHLGNRILQNRISGIPPKMGLGTRMSDPDVYVVVWAATHSAETCLAGIQVSMAYSLSPKIHREL